ncbi:unnamed protein product, partial [Durusdinium trenchii]
MLSHGIWLLLLCWSSVAEDDEVYLQNCYRLMDSQLRHSHIQDHSCQQKIAGIYCARSMEVEQPQIFQGQCRQPAAADIQSTEMVYRDFQSISLAVLVLAAYQSQLPVIKELVTSLWHSRHSFLIHVDQKFPVLHASAKDWAKGFDNIYVRSEVSVKRSGASLLAAEIYGITELLSLSKSWHYFILLSDSDQLVRISLKKGRGRVSQLAFAGICSCPKS